MHSVDNGVVQHAPRHYTVVQSWPITGQMALQHAFGDVVRSGRLTGAWLGIGGHAHHAAPCSKYLSPLGLRSSWIGRLRFYAQMFPATLMLVPLYSLLQILGLLDSPTRLRSLASGALTRSRPSAADEIASHILALATHAAD